MISEIIPVDENDILSNRPAGIGKQPDARPLPTPTHNSQIPIPQEKAPTKAPTTQQRAIDRPVPRSRMELASAPPQTDTKEKALEKKIRRERKKIDASKHRFSTTVEGFQETADAIPATDLPLPLLVAPLMDLSKPMDDEINLARLELIEKISSGYFNKKVETVFDLIDRLRLFHAALGDRIVREMSSLEKLYEQYKDQTAYWQLQNILTDHADPELKKVLTEASETYNYILGTIFKAKEIYESVPSLMPVMNQREYGRHIDPKEALGFAYAHLARVLISKEQLSEYEKTLSHADNFPPINRLGAKIVPVGIANRYAGATEILPPSPGLTSESEETALHLERWLHAYPPPALLQHALSQYKKVFDAFGAGNMADLRAVKQINDILALVAPEKTWVAQESLAAQYAEFGKRTKELSQFYTYIVPWFVLLEFDDQLTNERRKTPPVLSDLLSWAREQGTTIFQRLSESQIATQRAWFRRSQVRTIPPQNIALSINDLYAGLCAIEGKVDSLPIALKRLHPDFTPELIDEYELPSSTLIEVLLRAGVLKETGEKEYAFTSEYGLLMTLDGICELLGSPQDPNMANWILDLVQDRSILIDQPALTDEILKQHAEAASWRQAYSTTSTRLSLLLWALPATISGLYKPSLVTNASGEGVDCQTTNLSDLCDGGTFAQSYKIREWGDPKHLKRFNKVHEFQDDHLASRRRVEQKIKQTENQIACAHDEIAHSSENLESLEEDILVFLRKNWEQIAVLFTENNIDESLILKLQELLEKNKTEFFELFNSKWMLKMHLNQALSSPDSQKKWTKPWDYINTNQYLASKRQSVRNSQNEIHQLEAKKLELQKQLSEIPQPTFWREWSDEIVRPLLSSTALWITAEPHDKTVAINGDHDPITLRSQAVEKLIALITELDHMCENMSGSVSQVEQLLVRATDIVRKFEKEYATIGVSEVKVPTPEDTENLLPERGISEQGDVDILVGNPRADEESERKPAAFDASNDLESLLKWLLGMKKQDKQQVDTTQAPMNLPPSTGTSIQDSPDEIAQKPDLTHQEEVPQSVTDDDTGPNPTDQNYEKPPEKPARITWANTLKKMFKL